MGIASRRKKERKLQDNVTINHSDNPFLDYLLNTDLSSDLIPITDELISQLMHQKNMPKDYLLTMKKEGYKYSVSRGSFLMFDN
jgi:hypothetical protein